MNNNDDGQFEVVSRFVLEANKIMIELFGPDGQYADEDAHADELEMRTEIMELVEAKDLQELISLQFDYAAMLLDEDEDVYKVSNQRVLEVSGQDVKSVMDGLAKAGEAIMAKGTIDSREEFYGLYRYLDYVKENGSSIDKAMQVEQLLARYSDKYDEV